MSEPTLQQALAPLHTMVQTQAHWQLPEYVQITPPVWGWGIRLLAMAIGALLLLEFASSASRTEIAVLWLVLGGVALVLSRFAQRRSLPLGQGSLHPDAVRGCVVDVAGRSIRTEGVEPAQQWLLDAPQEWSIGCHAFRDRVRMHEGWHIQLRHVRKGTVLQLCTVVHAGHDVGPTDAVYALADLMAQRLGVRRVGARSVP